MRRNAVASLIVTWSRGMSRMLAILILSYRLKERIYSYVLHCFLIQRIVHTSAIRCSIEMGFWSKCGISNGQVTYVENSKLNIAEMWLIPLDRATIWETKILLSTCMPMQTLQQKNSTLLSCSNVSFKVDYYMAHKRSEDLLMYYLPTVSV